MSSTVFEIGLCIGTFLCQRKGMQLLSLQEPGFGPISEQRSKNPPSEHATIKSSEAGVFWTDS